MKLSVLSNLYDGCGLGIHFYNGEENPDTYVINGFSGYDPFNIDEAALWTAIEVLYPCSSYTNEKLSFNNIKLKLNLA